MPDFTLKPLNTAVTTALGSTPAAQTPAAPAAQTPAPLVTPDAPAAKAADLPTAPAARGGQRVGIPGLAMVQSQAAVDKAQVSVLELVPGRYPDAVSLPTMLKQLGSTPEGQAVVKGLLEKFTAQTGIPVPPAMVSAVLAKPERLVDVLAARPDQLAAGVDAVNLAYKSGKIADLPPMSRKLPATFDLAKLDAAPHARGPMEPKQLVPGLYQGDLPSDLTEAQAKQNMVMAEVLDRLGSNASAPAGEKFHVKYGSQTYSRLDSFLKALVADGHTVEARVEHRVANFADLKTRAPDGTWLDVPAALLVKTGVKDASGEEAMVPTVHSELVFSIKRGPTTKGPGFDADVKWYQGISGTGFFPANLAKTPAWCGGKVADTFTGPKALEAASLAGLFSDMVNDVAAAQKLAVGGYGITGVCNDSVAVVQHAMTGRSTAYPLLMRDETLAGELSARVKDKDKRDDASYTRLAKSVKAVPSDAVANDSARARALESMPWTAGTEPFAKTERSRVILTP